MHVCVVGAGDIFQSPLCCLLIVLGSCLPLCTINSIICTWPSQPSSPWATVFPSGVSALHAACHAASPLPPSPPPPSVGTGLARPRWDLLTFGHRPLQEVDGEPLASLAAATTCLAKVPRSGGEGRWGEDKGPLPRRPPSIFLCAQSITLHLVLVHQGTAWVTQTCF